MSAADLDHARHLAAHGVPVFLARPALDAAGEWDPTAGVGGYLLPRGWQDTRPDPRVLDAWRPGWAVCAVMGHAVDGLDVDPRNGGDASRAELVAAGEWPRSYGSARTPSGGTHDLVAPLGVRSRDNIMPGLDVKAGADGRGRGFLFVAPTVKLSKGAGELGAYAWTTPPTLDALDPDDCTGAPLAARIRDAREPRPTPTASGTVPTASGPNPAWVAAMMRGVLDDVRAAAPGTRNQTLNAAAYRVGRYVPGGHVDRADAEHALTEAGRAAGLATAETAATVRSGLDAGALDPLDPPQGRPGQQAKAASATPSWPDDPPEDPWADSGPDDAEPPFGAHEDTPDPEDAARALYGRLVAERVRALRVDRDARAALAAERQAAEPFDAGTLAAILARPPEPAARVAGLMPWQGSTLVVAQRKTGKTTWTLNLARSLITGAPFLGCLDVRPLDPGARVGLLNYEVSAAQLARWADDAGVPRERLFVVNLRGRRSPLTNPGDRAALAGLLRAHAVQTLIVDPFGRAYSGASQNDAGEVGAWLLDLDRFGRGEVGALDVVLTAHAGWNGERSRGSSALEDWADSIVTLTRDEDTGGRFMRATGRDVDLDEDRLDYDHATRTLRLSGDGSRKAAAASRRDLDTERAIVETLAGTPQGMSGKGLADALDRKDADFTRVRDDLVRRGVIRRAQRPGRGGGTLYTPGDSEGAEHAEKVPNAPSPNLPNLPSSSGGSGSGGSDPEPTENTGPRCADCGERCRPGHVRCADCHRVVFGGVR